MLQNQQANVRLKTYLQTYQVLIFSTDISNISQISN
jgi:hypothetical protein